MEQLHTRCLNLDWLEVYVLEDMGTFPLDANYFSARGYVVHERDYGTRVYAEMFTIDDEKGQPFLEVRRHPMSNTSKNGGLFPPNASHIRLTNYACYRDDAIPALRDFLALHRYEFVKIYRIDLALDFERFDRDDDPARFIERFMAGRYSKVNQTNISAHGQDNWNGRLWNSLSWGRPTSMISTKLYCKSMELAQAHDKPYIRWSWYVHGIIDDPIHNTKLDKDGNVYTPAIWRVEFSIKSSAKRWFLIERSDQRHGKIPMPYTLDTFDTHQRRLIIFSSLALHYFHFKHYEPDKRKDRCRDKVLFDFNLNDYYVKVERVTKAARPDNKLARIRAMLIALQMMTSEQQAIDAIETLLAYIDHLTLNDMVDTFNTTAEIRALQALIRDRMRGNKSKNVTTQYERLLDMFQDDVEIF